jgi:hypothetical protein
MEMDIYMRRRLVALGGLVAFFIIFVLLVKSCGDDEEPAAPLTETGATGGAGTVALPVDEFIAQADTICAQANTAVGALDPTDPREVSKERKITEEEFEQLQSLEVEEESSLLRQFMAQFREVVDALNAKELAIKNDDSAGAEEAQVALDTAEAEARQLGERYGFADCGQWLDAGESPSTAGATDTTGTDTTGTDTSGGVAPTDTGAAPTDTGTAPTDTGTAPTDTGTDGSDSGGISP